MKRAVDAPDEIGQAVDLLPDDAEAAGVRPDGGDSVKQGLHRGSRRAHARGRTGKVESGESAEFDQGRSNRAGRHYGATGDEEPGPGFRKVPGTDAEK
jgi:hypothetical protein